MEKMNYKTPNILCRTSNLQYVTIIAEPVNVKKKKEAFLKKKRQDTENDALTEVWLLHCCLEVYDVWS